MTPKFRLKRGDVRVFAYPKEFTTLPDYSLRRGLMVKVVRRCRNDEVDPACQPMYVIKASDGWMGHAWEDELIPHPLQEEASMTLTEVEKALLEGRISRLINPQGRYWKARRNGQTYVSKNGEWSIPVKAGFNHTHRLTSLSLEERFWGKPLWRIEP